MHEVIHARCCTCATSPAAPDIASMSVLFKLILQGQQQA
jgi:hypothetical protein